MVLRLVGIKMLLIMIMIHISPREHSHEVCNKVKSVVLYIKEEIYFLQFTLGPWLTITILEGIYKLLLIVGFGGFFIYLLFFFFYFFKNKNKIIIIYIYYIYFFSLGMELMRIHFKKWRMLRISLSSMLE